MPLLPVMFEFAKLPDISNTSPPTRFMIRPYSGMRLNATSRRYFVSPQCGSKSCLNLSAIEYKLTNSLV